MKVIFRSSKDGILGAAPSRSLVSVRFFFEISFMTDYIYNSAVEEVNSERQGEC